MENEFKTYVLDFNLIGPKTYSDSHPSKVNMYKENLFNQVIGLEMDVKCLQTEGSLIQNLGSLCESAEEEGRIDLEELKSILGGFATVYGIRADKTRTYIKKCKYKVAEMETNG